MRDAECFLNKGTKGRRKLGATIWVQDLRAEGAVGGTPWGGLYKVGWAEGRGAHRDGAMGTKPPDVPKCWKPKHLGTQMVVNL